MAQSKAGVTGLKFLKALVWIVYALATAASIIIAFGFALLIFDANIEAGFSKFIYTWSVKFMGPFFGMIEPTQLQNGGEIAWSALVAVVAYAVLAALVGGILNAISSRIYRSTHRRTVGQTTVTTTAQADDGTVVSTATTRPVVAPSPVEAAEAERQAANAPAPAAAPAPVPEGTRTRSGRRA